MERGSVLVQLKPFSYVESTNEYNYCHIDMTDPMNIIRTQEDE